MSSNNVLNIIPILNGMIRKEKSRQILAGNVRFLMEIHGDMSTHTLARKSGVSQRTIVNILNMESAPSIENVERIAKAFNLDLWHMTMPTLRDHIINQAHLERLIELYDQADTEGRALILMTAEREVKYSGTKK